MSLPYRPDIDFLRFVAVTLVVLYHAGYKLFQGGFIGVDVFFVISGFLIFNSIQNSNFSIINFYQRRFFRLIPALAVLIILALSISYFVLLPDVFELAGRTAKFSSLFIVNYFLIEQNLGYFQSWLTKKNIFLHLWSLSIEEQFYLCLPIILYLKKLLKLNERNINHFFLFFTITCFIYSEYLVQNGSIKAYYSFFSRCWEIGFGVLLAIFAGKKSVSLRNRYVNSIYIILLILLIGIGSVYSGKTAFPGANALIVVIITSSLIIIGPGVSGLLKRIINLKPLLHIGIISYSLYLWHWPVMSLNKQNIWFSLSRFETIILSLLLAHLSWKYVETPFKRFKFPELSWKSPAVLVTTLTGLFLFSSYFESTDRFYYYKFMAVPYTPEVLPTKENYPYAKWEYPSKAFWGTNSKTEITLLGDSFGSMWGPGLDKFFKENGLLGKNLTQQGCIFINLDINKPKCAEHRKSIKAFLKKNKPDSVILFGRWDNLFRKDIYPTNLNESVAKANIQRSFNDTVTFLKKHTKRVYIVIAPVEPGDPVLHLKKSKIYASQTVTAKGYLKNKLTPKSKFFYEYFKILAQDEQIEIIDPNSILCKEDECLAIHEGKILFHDGTHLSSYGSEYLVKAFSAVTNNLISSSK